MAGGIHSFAGVIIWASLATLAAALPAPLTKCYAVDANDTLHDFTRLAGTEFSADITMPTPGRFTLRLCKDASVKLSGGREVSFGRFAPGYVFTSSVANNSNLQQYYLYGDLDGCEKMGFGADGGRTTKVYVTCGSCPSGLPCRDQMKQGCLCGVSYASGHDGCLVEAVLALDCQHTQDSVFRGFSVGLNPRSQEVVNDGVTMWGYDSPEHSDYSYDTAQSKVSLYLSALSTQASLVGKPSYTVVPTAGLVVTLGGSAMEGAEPTTESPSVLDVSWRCDAASLYPFLINITVPVKGYSALSFLLGKQCVERQKPPVKASPGWATFGAVSCSFLVLSTLLCCAGFIYKTHAEDKRGLEALPGLPALSGCLDMASGLVHAYFPSNRHDRDPSLDSSQNIGSNPSSSYGAVQ